jgi:hypothetical protein
MAETRVKIRGALAESLARGRDRYNAKFAESKLGRVKVDEEEFAGHLAGVVAPIAEAVAVVAPEKVDATVMALYDISLDLFGRRLLGIDGLIDETWRKLLPAVPAAVASSPRRVVGAMSNAIHNLSRTSGARTAFWLDEMAGMGALFQTGDELLATGQIVAWRAGMAHLRRVALDCVHSLRPELATAALGIDYASDVHGVVEKLLVDPWADPVSVATHAHIDGGPQLRARVGAFRGFGGTFHTPPTVILVDGTFLVGDDESTWALSVDRFGATLTRAGLIDSGDEIVDPDPALRLTENGTVQAGEKTKRFEELAGATSWASDGDTLVVTLPFSHAVQVVSAR